MYTWYGHLQMEVHCLLIHVMEPLDCATIFDSCVLRIKHAALHCLVSLTTVNDPPLFRQDQHLLQCFWIEI